MRVIDLAERRAPARRLAHPHAGFVLGSELEFLDPPVGKDIDAQMVVDLRRMLSNAGYGR